MAELCRYCNRPPVDPIRCWVELLPDGTLRRLPLVACRACWCIEEDRAEALEHEFTGQDLEPIKYFVPRSAAEAARLWHQRHSLDAQALPRAAGKQPAVRRDPRPKSARLQQQIETARRRLAKRGIHVEAA